MTVLPMSITLVAAGGAAFINFWLGWRVGRVRMAEKISIGDGGNPRLIARMRAQLNFAEYVPLVLILIGLIELTTGAQLWLAGLAGLFLLGRVLHGFGMDGWSAGRKIGTLITMATMLGLGGYALALPILAGSTLVPAGEVATTVDD